jgi:pimeloyl-ACP methyl ester carboxylesterase
MKHLNRWLSVCALAFLALGFCIPVVAQDEPWLQLPAYPPMPEAAQSGLADVNGIQVYYAVYGEGDPVILLHGGLGHSDVWGHQVSELSKTHQVITMDSRGHGRSTRNDERYTYELMASDVVALMDFLQIDKASLIGWSDGGIIGLVMGIKNPERLERVFAFGANSDPSGLTADLAEDAVFNQYIENAGMDYAKLSATPDDYEGFLGAIGEMWATEPNITEQLKDITIPVTISDGEYDEAIMREHTEMMAKEIPGAKLVILPSVSHFAMWQNPEEFNAALIEFLAGN